MQGAPHSSQEILCTFCFRVCTFLATGTPQTTWHIEQA